MNETLISLQHITDKLDMLYEHIKFLSRVRASKNAEIELLDKQIKGLIRKREDVVHQLSVFNNFVDSQNEDKEPLV